MKLFKFILLFLPITLLGQSPGSKMFIQEVVTIHNESTGLPKGKIDKIVLIDDQPVAIAGSASYAIKNGKWAPSSQKSKAPAGGNYVVPGVKILSSVKFRDGVVLGGDKGLYFQKAGKKAERLFPSNSEYYWALRDVAVVTVDSKGRLWFGAEEGVGYLDGENWKLFTGKEGLPYNKFTSIAAAPNGIVWFGTQRGAIKAENDFFKYRFSRRWLPDDAVTGIVVQSNGTAWIATNAGVSQIVPTEMTFESKADYFTKQVETRHNRMGFVAQSHLKEKFNVATSEVAISDNDGMYTAKYGAAQAFRYAVTKDPEAKALADRSFKACKWLVDISHEPGFPARVIIPADWHEPVNEQYGREFNKRVQQRDPQWKDIYPRFPKSKDGKYMYKCDTSSDELAGHYFFYAIYYDLVAETPEEKQAARDVVRDITDHMIRHGYKLVDHDGKVTRWGDFSPEYFASVYGYDQRGLNSMMMLSFLNIAKHVTGDVKYDKEAQLLREKHNYHIFALHPKEFFPPENVVPWDNNLCLMSMYGLLKYEKDPSLLLIYRRALEVAWMHISKQQNPFWDAIYQSLADDFTKQVDNKFFEGKNLYPENHLFAPSIIKEFYKPSNNPAFISETLEKIPLDLIGYTMDNTHRLDVVFDPTPGQSSDMGWRTNGWALPVDERGHVRQDRDGFALNMSEGGGSDEHEGTFYLLPYYMAAYHGLLSSK